MDSTSSLHQIFKAIKIRKVWFETHTFQPWKNGMNEQHGATNGILFCREWNPWQSTTWICMAVGCCFGKSDPNIWTPRARWSCEPHSRIHKKNKKSKYSCAILIPNSFVQFFSFGVRLPKHVKSSELRSGSPSDRTTSPGTGGRPRNSWRKHGKPWQPCGGVLGVGFLGQSLLIFCW